MNTYETAHAIKGMNLQNARKYLEDVLEKKQCIPYRVYKGCIGRTPQAKQFKLSQGRWPVKSVKVILDLLQNAESNAEFKNLDTDNLILRHVEVDRAQGRINAYMSSPCHVQMIFEEKEEGADKPDEEEEKAKKFTRKQLAKRRLKVGQ